MQVDGSTSIDQWCSEDCAPFPDTRETTSCSSTNSNPSTLFSLLGDFQECRSKYINKPCGGINCCIYTVKLSVDDWKY